MASTDAIEATWMVNGKFGIIQEEFHVKLVGSVNCGCDNCRLNAGVVGYEGLDGAVPI
jgi:hypothetical protein